MIIFLIFQNYFRFRYSVLKYEIVTKLSLDKFSETGNIRIILSANLRENLSYQWMQKKHNFLLNFSLLI
jgi:hypothetical protein